MEGSTSLSRYCREMFVQKKCVTGFALTAVADSCTNKPHTLLEKEHITVLICTVFNSFISLYIYFIWNPFCKFRVIWKLLPFWRYLSAILKPKTPRSQAIFDLHGGSGAWDHLWSWGGCRCLPYESEHFRVVKRETEFMVAVETDSHEMLEKYHLNARMSLFTEKMKPSFWGGRSRCWTLTKELRRQFQEADQDGSGEIDATEACAIFARSCEEGASALWLFETFRNSVTCNNLQTVRPNIMTLNSISGRRNSQDSWALAKPIGHRSVRSGHKLVTIGIPFPWHQKSRFWEIS